MKYFKAALVMLMLLATCTLASAQGGSSPSPGYSTPGYSSTGQYCTGGACVQIVLAPFDTQFFDYGGMKVTLKQIGGTYTTCASDPDGTVEFNDVPPGYYFVTVCYSPSSWASAYPSAGNYCYYTKFCICVNRDYYDPGTWDSSDPCSNQYYAYPVKYDCSKDTYKTKFCCKGCPDCVSYQPPTYQPPTYQPPTYQPPAY